MPDQGKTSRQSTGKSQLIQDGDGWKTLIDGKSKIGWHVYHNNSDGSAWEVSEHDFPWQTRLGFRSWKSCLVSKYKDQALIVFQKFDNS